MQLLLLIELRIRRKIFLRERRSALYINDVDSSYAYEKPMKLGVRLFIINES